MLRFIREKDEISLERGVWRTQTETPGSESGAALYLLISTH